MGTVPPPRLTFSSALPVLLSRDIDKLCAERFRDVFSSMLDNLRSPRTMMYISTQRSRPEWDLVASLLFYGVSMARYGATPGMQFCGMSMIGEERISLSGGQGSSYIAVYSRVGSLTLLGLALLYSLEPYVVSRSDERSLFLQHIADLLVETEEAADTRNTGAVTHARSDLHRSEAGGAIGSEDGLLSSVKHAVWSLTSRITNAICSSVHSHLPSPAEKLRGLLVLVSDLSLFHFYSDSRYADVPLRLAGVRLYNEAPDNNTNNPALRHHARLRALALLLLVKFGLYSVSFTRFFVSDLLRRRVGYRDSAAHAELSGATPPHTKNNTGNDDSDSTSIIERLDSRNMSTRKCVLCIGRLQEPAAAPCGHVYCWGCIMELCRVARTHARKPACAICRSKFGAQSVRALYSYC